jgi:hypothetical protein
MANHLKNSSLSVHFPEGIRSRQDFLHIENETANIKSTAAQQFFAKSSLICRCLNLHVAMPRARNTRRQGLMRSRNRAVRLAKGRKQRKFYFKMIYFLYPTPNVHFLCIYIFYFYFMFKLKQKLTKMLFKLLPVCEITELRQCSNLSSLHPFGPIKKKKKIDATSVLPVIHHSIELPFFHFQRFCEKGRLLMSYLFSTCALVSGRGGGIPRLAL